MSTLQIQEQSPKGVDGKSDVVVELKDGQQVTIPAEEIRLLNEIIQRVSDNPKMQLLIGKPGQKAFKIMHTDYQVVEGEYLVKSPHMRHFVVGHEAAHEISRSMQEIGLKKSQALQLANSVGCMYIHNAIEDPAVNNYMCIRVPALYDEMVQVYDEMFVLQNAPMVAHDAIQVAAVLGKVPRYVQYGSELIRHWHCGEYSKRLDPDVRLALDQTLGKVKEIWETIPKNGSSDKKLVVNAARLRFLKVHEYVWPNVQRLIRLDVDDARRQQQIDQISNQQGGNGNSGDQGKGKGGNGDGSVSQDVSDEVANEIQSAQGKAKKRVAQEISEELKQLKEEIDKSRKEREGSEGDDSGEEDRKPRSNEDGSDEGSQGGFSKSNEEPEEGSGEQEQTEEEGGSGSEDEDQNDGVSGRFEDEPSDETDREDSLKKALRKKIEDLTSDPEAADDLEGKVFEGDAEALKQAIENALKSKDIKVTPQDLSEKARQELERAFNKLSDEDKAKIIEQAKESLRNIENKINASINPREQSNPDLNPDSPLSNPLANYHPDGDDTPDTPRSKPGRINFDQVNNTVKMLEDARVARLSEWDKETERVTDDVNQMYKRILKRVLAARYPDWDSGHIVGPELDTFAAMQAEFDPRYLTQMFKKRIVPTELDWAAEIVIDTSPSMKGVIEPQFQAIVFISELLEKLHFDFQVGEFSSGVIWHKDWDDKLSDEKVREKLSKILSCSGGTTLDGDAIEHAYNEVQKVNTPNKLIVLFSDADSMQPGKLVEVVRTIRDEGNTLLVHYGIGAHTKDIIGYYPISYGGLAIDGTKGCLTRNKVEKSIEQQIHEQFAAQVALYQEGGANSAPDFYETFFETIVDILMYPKRYFAESRRHEPAKRFLNKEMYDV